MVRPRSEQIVPGLIEPGAIGAVDHVLGEELVAALVLHLHHERVVLGAVVGVVERRRHRILVGRVRLAVRVRRQQRRRTRRCRRGTSRSRRSSDRRGRRAGRRRAREPSGRSEIITRTTAFRSLPSSASAWNSSDVARRPARRSRTTPCRSSRSRRARSRVPSGLVPNASGRRGVGRQHRRAASCVESTGPARRGRRGGAAGCCGAPRQRRGPRRPRASRRGLRQIDDRRRARRRDSTSVNVR